MDIIVPILALFIIATLYGYDKYLYQKREEEYLKHIRDLSKKIYFTSRKEYIEHESLVNSTTHRIEDIEEEEEGIPFENLSPKEQQEALSSMIGGN